MPSAAHLAGQSETRDTTTLRAAPRYAPNPWSDNAGDAKHRSQTSRSRASEPITAVSGFGQRVGAEAKTRVGVHYVVNDGGVSPRVKVIHQLGALVAQKTGVFKTSRAFHVINLT